MEEWRPIPSFPAYEASSLGRVRRIELGRSAGHGKVRASLLRPDGYVVVSIGRSPRFVHRLVCEAFNGVGKAGHVVAHRNGARADNRPENLRWATYAENERDKRAHGTATIGSRQASAKLTDAAILAIRSAYRLGLGTQTEIGRVFGVAQTRISDIVSHKSWRHVE